MFSFVVFLVACLSSPLLLTFCEQEFEEKGFEGKVEILATGHCDVLMTSRQSPLNNPCQEEEAPTWPLQDLIEKVRTNKPTAAHKNVEWAMWQRPDDGTVVVQILSEVGQYEMSLIWAIEPEETEGGRWTAWTTRDVSGENVLYVTLEIGSAGDRATALERLQVLEDLQIIRVPKNE